LKCRATEHRVNLVVDNELANATLDLFDAELFATEVLLEQCIVSLSNRLNELGAVLFSACLQISRNLLRLVVSAEGNVTLRVALPDECLHGEQVDNANEVAFRADWQLHYERLRTEAVHDGVYGEVEVGTHL